MLENRSSLLTCVFIGEINPSPLFSLIPLIYLPIKRWNLNDRRPTNSMCIFCFVLFCFFLIWAWKDSVLSSLTLDLLFSFFSLLIWPNHFVFQLDPSLFLLLLKHFRKELLRGIFTFLFPVLFCPNLNLIPCFFFLFLFVWVFGLLGYRRLVYNEGIVWVGGAHQQSSGELRDFAFCVVTCLKWLFFASSSSSSSCGASFRSFGRLCDALD